LAAFAEHSRLYRAKLHETTCANSLKRFLPKGHAAISAFLGVPIQVLWPEWYDRKGERHSHLSRPKGSPTARQRHRQIGDAE